MQQTEWCCFQCNHMNETQIIALNHNFNQFISHLFTAKNDDVELVEVVPLEKRNTTLGLDEYDDDYPPASFIPVAYFPFNIDFRSLFTGFDGKKFYVHLKNEFLIYEIPIKIATFQLNAT